VLSCSISRVRTACFGFAAAVRGSTAKKLDHATMRILLSLNIVIALLLSLKLAVSFVVVGRYAHVGRRFRFVMCSVLLSMSTGSESTAYKFSKYSAFRHAFGAANVQAKHTAHSYTFRSAIEQPNQSTIE
jgi:hypothetical protein